MRVAVDHRDAILQTAAKLFARKPFHEVLMDDVAEQTGIAKGTIYRYYPNKEELFISLALRHIEIVGTEIGKVAAISVPPLKRLEQMLARLAELIKEHRDFFQVMMRHECDLWARHHSELTERRTVIRDHIANVIREAQKEQMLDDLVEASIAADMLLGMVRNVHQFTQPQPEPERIAALAMHIFTQGLKPGANRSGYNGGIQ